MLTEEGVFAIIDAYRRLARQGEKILAFRADEYYWRDLGRPADSPKPPSIYGKGPFDGLCCADYTRIARVFMGLTHIKLNIANPARPKRAVELSFLVDSGAVYSVIPSALLRKLGVRPHSKRTFTLADGCEITRKIGDVLFRLNGRRGAAPVIFGEKQDSVLLGTVSLEALGMMLDPMKRELRPLPMLLVPHTPSL